jgi:hypothetical protein
MSFLLGMLSAMLIFISDLSIFMSVIEMVQSQFDDTFWQGFKEGLCNITRGCRIELLPHNL